MITLKERPNLENKKILLVRLDRIGDLMVSTPAIHAFREAYPQAQIDMLASELNAPVLKYNKDINTVYVFHKKNILSYLPLILKLKAQKYAAIFCFTSGSKTSNNVIRFIPAPMKVAFGGIHKGYEKIYTHTIGQTHQEHIVYILQEQLASMGIEVKSNQFVFPISEEIQKRVESLYPKKENKFRMVLFIGNIKKTQNRWETYKFVKLIELLMQEKDIELFVMAGESDVPLLEDFKSLPTDAFQTYIGKDLYETGAFLTHTNLLVASSSGPAHIAFAVGCPIVSLVTTYNERIWRPLGEHDICITPDSDIEDMRGLEVDLVYEEIMKVYEKLRHKKA